MLGGTGVILTIATGAVQFRHFGYAMKNTFGKVFEKSDEPGALSPFQAACSALASSIGASNIVGVPTAIALGGPGAVFWMWLIAFVGMATKFSEVALGIKYREKNEKGEWIGGPFHYLSKGVPETIKGDFGKGLGKFLAIVFSFFLMIEIVPSVASQAVSVADNAATLGIPKIAAVLVLLVITVLVVCGGLKAIGNVADKLVPFMAIAYTICAIIILIKNGAAVPSAFASIFSGAFTGTAAVGGFTGAAVSQAIRWGVARGCYSNEAGMGEAACAHATASVKHPVQQGFWGIFEVFIDTIVVCSMTALVVITSGSWTTPDVSPATIPGLAFQGLFGEFGGKLVVTIILLCFVVSTIIVIIFYCEKQAEALFGKKVALVMRFICFAAIIAGAYADLTVAFTYLDFLLGIAVIANLIGLVIMAGQVKKLTKEYFENKELYKK